MFTYYYVFFGRKTAAAAVGVEPGGAVAWAAELVELKPALKVTFERFFSAKNSLKRASGLFGADWRW